MESGKFKDKLADGEDLHLRLLEALLANGIQDMESQSVCGRDVSDPRYAEVCFDALYHKEVALGTRFLPDFLAAHRSAPNILDREIVLELVGEMKSLPVDHAMTTKRLRVLGVSSFEEYLDNLFAGILFLAEEVGLEMVDWFGELLGWKASFVPYPAELLGESEGRFRLFLEGSDFPSIDISCADVSGKLLTDLILRA